MVDSGTSSRSAESAVQSISAEVRCEETDISHMGLHAWRVVISWHTMHSMHSRQALCSRSPADILHPGHSNELLFAQTLVQGRNFKLPIRPPTQATSYGKLVMSEQRTLEDVGVKRLRSDADDDNTPTPSSDTQPPPKKTHTGDTTQNKAAGVNKSKENQASTSNVPVKDDQATKEKVPKQAQQQEPKQKPTEPESKQPDSQPKKPEQTTADTADAKEPLPSSVPKPEGLVEEGRVYFLYRPRVNVDHPTSVDDIQRFFMIMAPTSRPKAPFRLIIVGKKRLPIPDKHERFFCFTDAVADSMEKLTEQLGETGNQSATRGYRTTEPARIVGEGVYEIVSRDARKTSFAYKLEIPEEPGEVQQELQIKKEASYTISMKNPGNDEPPNAGLSNKADYKGGQKKQFGGYRWIACHDPSVLDAEHCEFILIGATEDLQGQMGEGGEHLQKAASEDIDNYLRDVAPDGVDEHDALIAKLRDETHAAQADLPTEAAATGKWQ